MNRSVSEAKSSLTWARLKNNIPPVMRIGIITIAVCAVAILSGQTHAEATRVAFPGGAAEDDILVGVDYFAGWWKELPNKWHGLGWTIGQPDWRPEFPERLPTLGQYNEQATMDREIIAASDHGVDFFAILWYYPKPGTYKLDYPRGNFPGY